MARVNTCPCSDCDATTKACIECAEEKPLSAFYRHAEMGDGHLNKCKECVREYQRRRHREKIENDPEWRERERERSRKKWRERHHLWSSSSRSSEVGDEVKNAVRRGDLVPASRCEDCGHDFSEFRREAHHPDYDEPLEVEWLCSLCHGKRHREAACPSRSRAGWRTRTT